MDSEVKVFERKIYKYSFNCSLFKGTNWTNYMRIHNGVKSYQCDTSKHAFNSKSHLFLHLISHWS